MRKLIYLVVTLLLVGFSGSALYLKKSGKISTPSSSVSVVINALTGNDIQTLTESGLRKEITGSINAYGRAKHKELMLIFREILKSGERDYRAFIKKIQTIGKSEFKKMSKEERALLSASIGEERFIMERGIKKLPKEERQLIKDVEKFLSGKEKESFCLRAGMSKVPHEKWEKVKNYEYSILSTQGMRFIREEGKKILKQNIEETYGKSTADIGKVEYEDSIPGSLFRGSNSRVTVEFRDLQTGDLIVNTVFKLSRNKGTWYVERTFPPLF